jgi:phosphohistidine phosphatase
MKTLTLFRHAKSGWDAPVDRDFDRPINARGTKGARLIGKYLASKGWRFDYVISSPAVRCTETLDVLWEGYGEILHPNWDRRIYLASGATLLDVVQDLPDSVSSVLMCGHNPGLEDLILMLVPDQQGALHAPHPPARFGPEPRPSDGPAGGLIRRDAPDRHQ